MSSPWRALLLAAMASGLCGCLGTYPHTADEIEPSGTYEGELVDTNVYQSLNSPQTCDVAGVLPDYVTPPKR